jgi:hypothetical protein
MVPELDGDGAMIDVLTGGGGGAAGTDADADDGAFCTFSTGALDPGGGGGGGGGAPEAALGASMGGADWSAGFDIAVGSAGGAGLFRLCADAETAGCAEAILRSRIDSATFSTGGLGTDAGGADGILPVLTWIDGVSIIGGNRGA